MAGSLCVVLRGCGLGGRLVFLVRLWLVVVVWLCLSFCFPLSAVCFLFVL